MSITDKLASVLKRPRSNATLAQEPAGLPEDAHIVEPPNPPSRDELVALVKSFSWWYQRIYLGRGVYTLDEPAHHEGLWRWLATRVFPADLKGMSVLDIGCNAGYFSIQAKRCGAGRVVGIDPVEDYLRQAEACRRIWGLDIEYLAMDAHQIDRIQDPFDIVIFTGILYHLKNPLHVLEAIGRICQDAVVVESEVMAEQPGNVAYVRQGPPGQVRVTQCRKGIMKFIEGEELNADGGNWWIPDTECVLGMLRTAGFQYFSAPYYPSEGRLLLVASKKRESILDLRALR